MIRAGRCSRHWLVWAFGLGVLATSCVSDSLEPVAPVEPTIPEDIGERIDAFRNDEGIPGLVTALAQAGETRYVARGLTHASGELRRPVQPTDPFFLGSATKVFTAVLVLQFVEEGRLSLLDRVDRWIPEFPSLQDETVVELLSHRSGLADVYSYIYYRPDREEMLEFVQRRWELEEILDLAGGLERRFDPGERFEYSSTNYLLLGVLLERVSGEAYVELLRARILERLDMQNTWLHGYETPKRPIDWVGHLGPVESWPHSEMFGELSDASMLDVGNIEYATGGIVSTAADSLRFIQGLVGGELLRPESLELMREFRVSDTLGVGADENEAEMRYGLGLVEMVRWGRRFEGHGGIYNGWTTGVWYVADCDLFIIFSANRGFINGRRFLDTVVESTCGEPSADLSMFNTGSFTELQPMLRMARRTSVAALRRVPVDRQPSPRLRLAAPKRHRREGGSARPKAELGPDAGAPTH